MGFTLKISLEESWGDDYYIGLCGIEINDEVRGKCNINPEQLFTKPFSVCELPGMQVSSTITEILDPVSDLHHQIWVAFAIIVNRIK